jgi:hypothetical protein
MRKFKGIRTNTVYTEIFSDEKGSLLEAGDIRTFYGYEFVRDWFEEVKEPVKITFWKNLWQRKDGSYFFGCDWPDEISAIRDAKDIPGSLHKFVETVKFEHIVEGK